MDPLSLSLVALSASSMAIRRSIHPDTKPMVLPRRRLTPARAGAAAGPSGDISRPRSLSLPSGRAISIHLAQFAAEQGLRLARRDGADEGAVASWRPVDFLLTDLSDRAACAIAIEPTVPTDADAVCLRQAVPHVTVFTGEGWHPNRARLMAALSLDPSLAA